MTTSRHWCFTEYKKLNGWDKLPDKTRYICWQTEICPATGREHIQGYIELYQPTRIKQVQQLLNTESTHMEKRRGSRDQARAYCKKDESRKPLTLPQELGNWNEGGQGKRNDIEEIKEMIEDGNTLIDIIHEHTNTYIKYNRGIEKMYEAIKMETAEKQKFFKKDIKAITGTTGSGKTWFAMNEFERVFKCKAGKWYDGYDGHEHVLFDDFAPNQIAIETLLQLLDDYYMTVEIKGGTRIWCPKTIRITSNIPVDEWYLDATKEHRAALQRRLGPPIVLHTRHEVGGNTIPPLKKDEDETSEKTLEEIAKYN